MKKSIYFLKKLTAAEVGLRGTHEIYVRLPNDFDYESFFPSMAWENGTVIQVDFLVTNGTIGHANEQNIPLKFVYYANSNKEKRIPSLGDFFSSNDVQEGDVVCLESRQENGKTSFYITFTKANLATLNPAAVTYSIVQEEQSNETLKDSIKYSLQQIYYGAPGTGKSHIIYERTADKEVIRTTFHPDSDYSTFVGAYKPTTIDEDVMTVIGTKAVPVTNEDGSQRKETKIVYEFVSQAFLKAYVAAWKFYAEVNEDEAPKEQYLVIEEINRGNCAQIFGDLFQLLDRNDHGFSDYPITADDDMKKQLKKAFDGLTIAKRDAINACYKGKDVVNNVLSGDILLLPNNLYIWATMNTSDQSLFPIDSAFKRRWDWQYMPISNANMGWSIEAGGKKYDWWKFLQAINKKIFDKTHSEDKQLGYFFCKANKENHIKSDRFVGKVIFYIWNDIFKDYEFDDDIFNDPDGGKLSFDKFYTTEGKDSKVIEDNVVTFLGNLGVNPQEEVDTDDSEEGFDDSFETIESPSNKLRNYNVNGDIINTMGRAAFQAVKLYAESHPSISADELINVWSDYNKRYIITDDEYLQKKEKSKDGKIDKRYEKLHLSNTDIVHVHLGFVPETMDKLIDFVNKKHSDWNIYIQEVNQ